MRRGSGRSTGWRSRPATPSSTTGTSAGPRRRFSPPPEPSDRSRPGAGAEVQCRRPIVETSAKETSQARFLDRVREYSITVAVGRWLPRPGGPGSPRSIPGDGFRHGDLAPVRCWGLRRHHQAQDGHPRRGRHRHRFAGDRELPARASRDGRGRDWWPSSARRGSRRRGHPQERQRQDREARSDGAVGDAHAMSHAPSHAHVPEAEPFTKSLERMNRFQEPEARALIADLALPPGSRGLDVGCGAGLFALWLAEAVGPHGCVVGIEPTADRADAARALIGPAMSSDRLQFRPGDATAIDAAPGTFDWIWCGDVLHHIQQTDRALGEFARVLRPGGRLIVKESQLLAALFLPGHPALERRLRQAEMEWSRHEGGEYSFEERRQRTLASVRAAGFAVESFRTHLLERRAPLPDAAREYIARVVFERNWGPRLRDRLTPDDWTLRSTLCDADSPAFALDDPAYYCLYPISVLTARR